MSTSFRAIRLLQYAVLICLEATLIHLVGVFVSGATPLLRWWVLVAVATLAAMVTSRFEPLNAAASRIRQRTGLIALAAIAWATAAHQGTFNPLAIPRTLALLLALDDPRFLAVYLGLAASMWAWWRGTAVVDQGHAEVMRALRRNILILVGVLSLLGITGFDPVFDSATGLPRAGVAAEMTAYLLLGFVGLSLARIVEAADHGSRGAEWRWLRSSLASTSLVLLLGLIGIALLADPAGTVLREIVRWVVYGLIALLAPLIAVTLLLTELIRQLVPRREAAPPIVATAAAGPDSTAVPAAPSAVADALLAIPTIILLLLPIIALLLVILFARRRRSRTDVESGEERESIFSWGMLRADLADLLHSLRRPAGDEGLPGALRRLLSKDPATRIRRRYVQLLLKGEAAGHRRPPHQTPHEFAPALTRLPAGDQAVDTLTVFYERARYAPTTVDDTTAAEADRVWEMLDRDQPPRRG